MSEENRESTWKILTSQGYSLIFMGGVVGGFKLVSIMLDIKKQGIEWLDSGPDSYWIMLCFGSIFIGLDFLTRRTFKIPSNWVPPHFYRSLITGFVLGFALHTALWLWIGR